MHENECNSGTLRIGRLLLNRNTAHLPEVHPLRLHLRGGKDWPDIRVDKTPGCTYFNSLSPLLFPNAFLERM